MPANTLDALLLARATSHPHRGYRALDDRGEVRARTDYPELLQQTRAVAVALRQAGCGKGDRVLLLFDDVHAFVLAFLSCAMAGAVPVPVPAPHPARFQRQLPRLLAVARDADPAIIATSDHLLAGAKAMLGSDPALRGLPWLAVDRVEHSADDWVDPGLSPDDPALLQYTSGSTGHPKGVVVTHRNMMAALGILSELANLGERHRLVTWLPVYHDLGLIGGVLCPIYDGGEVFQMSPMQFLRDPSVWLRAVTRHGATITGGPTFAFDLVARRTTDEQLASLDLRSVDVFFCGGEPVRHDTLVRFGRRFAPVGYRPETFLPSWGMAEATLSITGVGRGAPGTFWLEPGALERGTAVPTAEGQGRPVVSNGPTAGDMEVVAVDDDGGPLAPWMIGELWVRGTAVGAGYWRRPDDTAATFGARLATEPEGAPWLRTGDLGFVTPDGQVVPTGRMKDLLILRGRNLYPHDVEQVVEEAGLFVRPGGSVAVGVVSEGSESLMLAVELDRKRAPADLDLDELTGRLRTVVTEAFDVSPVAVAWLAPGELPKTPSGKAMRRRVAAAFVDGSLDSLHLWRSPPRSGMGLSDTSSPSEVLQALLQHLGRVLGVKARPDDSLRSLGLDSLQVVQLTDSLRDALKQPAITPHELLDAPSLSALAEALAALPPHVPRGTTPLPLQRARHRRSSRQRLSLWQEAIVAWEQARPPNSTWVELYRVHVGGPLHHDTLERALHALVQRQPSLRLGVDRQAGTLPSALPAAAFSVRHEDRRGARGAELDAAIDALARKPMVMQGEPLLSVHLWAHADDEHTLLLRWHQLLHDGTGGPALADELLELYASLREQRPPELPRLPVSYADYLSWERTHANDRGAERVESVRQALASWPPLRLPGATPTSSAIDGIGGDWVIDPLTTARFRELLTAAGLGFYEGIASVCAVVLSAACGQAQVGFVSPTSTRNRQELLPVVGRFGAWAPMRFEVGDEQLLGELARQVRPQRDLLDDPIPGTLVYGTDDPFEHPLGQVIVNTPNPHAASPLRRRIADLTLDEEPPHKPLTSRSQLSLVFVQTRGHLVVRVTGHPERFEPAAIEALAEQLTTAIARFRPEATVASLRAHLDAGPGPGVHVATPPVEVVRTPSFLLGDPLADHPVRTRHVVATEEAFLTPELLQAWFDRPQAPVDAADNALIDQLLSFRPYARYLLDQLLDLGSARLEAMQAASIDHAVLSLVSPGVQTLPSDLATPLAARANDLLARAVQRHPGQLSGLAALDPSDPQAAAEELRRAVGSLGLCGAVINSHTAGVTLEHPRFAPLLTALEDLGVPLYLHPRNPPAPVAEALALPDGRHLTEVMWGFHADTSLHVARMIVGGVFERHPGLQLLLGHLGEGLPMLLFRMDWAARVGHDLSRPPSETFRRHVRVTTSGIYDAPESHEALQLCRRLLGAERMLFAADHPFARGSEATAALMAADLDDGEREAIAWRNAADLFGLSLASDPAAAVVGSG